MNMLLVTFLVVLFLDTSMFMLAASQCSCMLIYVAAIQVPVSGSGGGVMVQQTPQGPRLVMPQRTGVTAGGTASIGTASGTLGGLQLLQTSTGQLLLTTAPVQKPANATLSHG